MCQRGGIRGQETNVGDHSLMYTSLFHSNFKEKLSIRVSPHDLRKVCISLKKQCGEESYNDFSINWKCL